MIEYVDLLKNHGLKATFQRMHLLEVLHYHGHLDIEEIYAEVTKIHPSLSLATVYKNIIIMIEKGVLVEVPIIGKKSKYEIVKQHHMHTVCTKCGRVDDLDTPYSVLDDLKSIKDFNVMKQEITVYGVCSYC